MAKHLRVEVTQADIERAAGKRRQDGASTAVNCPIACAVTRLTPDAETVSAFWSLRITHRNGEQERYSLTKKAAEFMDRWDRQGQARPTVLSFKPAVSE